MSDRYLVPATQGIVDGHLEFEAKAILDSKIHYKKQHYLVDFGDADPEWIRASNLPNCPFIIADYHHRYSTRPAAAP